MSINEGEQNIRNGLAILSFNIPPPLRNVKEFIKLSLNSSADNLMSDKIFKLRLASSDERRAQAYELLQKKFSVPDNSAAFLRLKENPQRISLLIDMKDTPVGTITIVFDSRLGLDADHLFKNELDLLRERGAKLSEITNLAMDGAPKGRRVMAAFVNMAYIYARKVYEFSDFVVEVKARHFKYYEKMLGFRQISQEKSCTWTNEPVALLRLELSYMDEQIRRYGGSMMTSPEQKSLYPYFFRKEDESGIANRLIQRHRP